jgi:hypothetical protein
MVPAKSHNLHTEHIDCVFSNVNVMNRSIPKLIHIKDYAANVFRVSHNVSYHSSARVGKAHHHRTEGPLPCADDIASCVLDDNHLNIRKNVPLSRFGKGSRALVPIENASQTDKSSKTLLRKLNPLVSTVFLFSLHL